MNSQVDANCLQVAKGHFYAAVLTLMTRGEGGGGGGGGEERGSLKCERQSGSKWSQSVSQTC